MSCWFELPFPEAGEGVVIRYRNQDIAAIQEKLGEGWVNEVNQGLDKFSPEIFEVLVNNGAKKDGESTFKLKMVDLDHVPLFNLGRLLLDGLSLRLSGKLYADWTREVAEKQAREAKRAA